MNDRQAMFLQKAVGLALIAISVVLVFLALHSNTMMGQDVTPVLFTAPMGLLLLFSKEILCDF